MRMFLRKAAAGRDPLAVAMIGVRMGERLLQIGLDDPVVAGMLAARTGISGHAATVVVDDHAAARARKGAERSAALIDVHVGPLHPLAFESGAFDVVVVHGVNTPLAALSPDARAGALREWHRVLRTGGRVVVIEAGTPTGLAALFRGSKPERAGESDGTVSDLERAGFTPARLLADREGYRFIEGLKA